MLSQKLQDQYYSDRPSLRVIPDLVPSHWVHSAVTERELVEDSLIFLESGVSSYFKEDPVTHDFRLSRAIEVKHLSPESLKRQLDTVAIFYSSHNRIETRVSHFEVLEGAIMQRLIKAIQQVQSEVKLELSYLQIIFGMQHGK